MAVVRHTIAVVDMRVIEKADGFCYSVCLDSCLCVCVYLNGMNGFGSRLSTAVPPFVRVHSLLAKPDWVEGIFGQITFAQCLVLGAARNS